MSKLNEIQSKLLTIDGAAFQKLGDSYLHAEGHGTLMPRGSVYGKDKTRTGTPDSLFRTQDGRYVLVEYTTQEQRLLKKLQCDLSKCLDEEKTGLPLEAIAKVILCFVGELDGDSEQSLQLQCMEVGCELELIDRNQLSFVLHQYYPGLAREFLGVSIDTGQILSVEAFVAEHERNRITTTLKTEFLFREEELAQCLIELDTVDVILLSGQAGVGKTRLALEVARRYAEANDDWSASFILNHNLSLFDDLQIYFGPSGNYLIVIDDANHVSDLQHILRLRTDARPDRYIKLILTVRDYAADNVISALEKHTSVAPIALELLTAQQIRELVYKQFRINHPAALERIEELAAGNPRLAMMAAQSISERNNLSGVTNAYELYKAYFESITNDLYGMNDNKLLKTAAMIAYMHAIDLRNSALINEICQLTGAAEQEITQHIETLHQLEVADIFEDTIVKISDQVLATYFVYIALFRHSLIDITALLAHARFGSESLTVESLNSVINAFNTEETLERLREGVQPLWTNTSSGSEERILLMNQYWFIFPTETLLEIKRAIAALDASSENYKLSFTPPAIRGDRNIVDILARFRGAQSEYARLALELAFSYVDKRPNEAWRLLDFLTRSFFYHSNSALRRFELQKAVVEVLRARLVAQQNELNLRLFQEVAVTLLDTQYESNRFMRSVMYWSTNRLPITPDLISLRKSVWSHIFWLFRNTREQETALAIIRQHAQRREVADAPIVKVDAVSVRPFFDDSLDSTQYSHCYTVHLYLNKLEEVGVDFEAGIRRRFEHPTLELACLIVPNRDDIAEFGVEEEEHRRKERFLNYTSIASKDEVDELITACDIVASYSEDHMLTHKATTWAIPTALEELAHQNPHLCLEILNSANALHTYLDFSRRQITNELIRSLGEDDIWDRFSRFTDIGKRSTWQFALLQILPEDKIDAANTARVRGLYETTPVDALPRYIGFLAKYQAYDQSTLAYVVSYILSRFPNEDAAHIVSALFGKPSPLFDFIPAAFADNLLLLQKAYFLCCEYGELVDFDAESFVKLVEVLSSFPVDFVEAAFGSGRHPSRWTEHKRWHQLWHHPNHAAIVSQMLNTAQAQKLKSEPGYSAIGNQALRTFLRPVFGWQANGEVPPPDIDAKITAYCRHIIEGAACDRDLMQLIFGLVADGIPHRRIDLISVFLERNSEIDDFKSIGLEPLEYTRLVHTLDELKLLLDFLNSLLPAFNGIEFLEHRCWIESEIAGVQRQIIDEKRTIFAYAR